MIRGRRGLPAARLLLSAVVAGLLLTVAPLAARAQPAPDPSSPAQPSPAQVTLTLDSLSPQVVSGAGDLVVTGRVGNATALPVRGLALRVQRGGALAGDRAVGRGLDGADPAEAARSAAVGVPGVLDPGRTAPFLLRVPLRGPGDGSLALDAAGVYPLLVAATGSLGGAGDERLAATRFLLPVLGPPPPPGATERLSVLLPIADRPRRLPVLPGAPTLLADDTLATSFAPGGRLSGLVEGLARGAPPGSPAAAATCVAVDADLLETAAGMAAGYQVRDTEGTELAGTGGPAAARWLASLRETVRGRCVLALPYADADVVATSRGNLADLTTTARVTGARRVGDLLGVPPLPDTTWPADGLVDERSLADLATGGARAVLVDGAAVRGPGGPPPAGGVARLPGPGGVTTTAVALDPLAARALAPRADMSTGTTGSSPAGTDAPLATQDALAVAAARTVRGGGTSVLAPPVDWAARADDVAALLATVGQLAGSGRAVPADVAALVASAPDAPSAALAGATPDDAVAPLDDTVLARAREVRDQQRDLLAASFQDGPGAPSPQDFVDPLTADLMRGLSASGRGNPPAARAAVGAVGDQMDLVRSMVRVVQPSGPYSLGSNDAPLLLTIENRLPVAVRVDVTLEPTPGLATSPLPEQPVPAFGSRQVQVGIQVIRSGQFSVDAQARTPGGEPLGPTSRLLLQSTAYGTITVWLTASAAVVLVILASVRITRRVRAARRSRPRRHRRDPATTPTPDHQRTP